MMRSRNSASRGLCMSVFGMSGVFRCFPGLRCDGNILTSFQKAGTEVISVMMLREHSDAFGLNHEASLPDQQLQGNRASDLLSAQSSPQRSHLLSSLRQLVLGGGDRHIDPDIPVSYTPCKTNMMQVVTFSTPAYLAVSCLSSSNYRRRVRV